MRCLSCTLQLCRGKEGRKQRNRAWKDPCKEVEAGGRHKQLGWWVGSENGCPLGEPDSDWKGGRAQEAGQEALQGWGSERGGGATCLRMQPYPGAAGWKFTLSKARGVCGLASQKPGWQQGRRGCERNMSVWGCRGGERLLGVGGSQRALWEESPLVSLGLIHEDYLSKLLFLPESGLRSTLWIFLDSKAPLMGIKETQMVGIDFSKRSNNMSISFLNISLRWDT